jgi:uncharacterized membrane protein HdeD (DUF308 family)
MSEQMSRAEIEAAVAEIRRQVSDHWGWFLALGIVLLIAGAIAIAFPLISAVAIGITLGWIFLIGGVLLALHAFSATQWRGFLWELLLGLLYVLAGGYLLFFPIGGVVTLTILLAAMFIAEGIIEISMALRVRPHGGWGWLLFSGIVALAVGGLIGLGLPGSAGWAIGLLAGINLLSTGFGFLFLALAGQRASATYPVT